jgi:hypothetical protein
VVGSTTGVSQAMTKIAEIAANRILMRKV